MLSLKNFSLIFVFLFLANNNPVLAKKDKSPKPVTVEYSEEKSPLYSSPRATMKTFLTSMKKYKMGSTTDLDKAINALELSHFDPASRPHSGKILAIKIVQTIDKIKFVTYENIPDVKQGPIWYFEKTKVDIDGFSYPVEIAIAQNKFGNWKFTKETLSSIEYYHRALSNKENVKGTIALVTWREKINKKLPKWFFSESFIFTNGQWIALFLIILIALSFDRVTRLYIEKSTQKIMAKKNLRLRNDNIKKFTFPFGLMVFALTWIIGVQGLEFPHEVLGSFLRGGYIVLTLGGVWAAHHLVDVISFYFESLSKRSENKFDDILVPLLRKSAKVLVICVGAVFIGHSLTLNVTNMLAGLGIGGLAFALAAKDTLSNLFGSLTVILDRPFQIGDWVKIGDNIEGTIEEVGFRSTRVRTFYDSLISVPNSVLTNIHIDNLGKRNYRRYTTHLGVQYDTSPKLLEAFCEGIRQIIIKSPKIRKDYFHCYFHKFNDSSLDILLYVFFKVEDWNQELAERHRLLMAILRLGEEMGIEFAFPTQTLHLNPENGQSKIDLKMPYKEAKRVAEKMLQNPTSMDKARSGLSTGMDNFPEDKLV